MASLVTSTSAAGGGKAYSRRGSITTTASTSETGSWSQFGGRVREKPRASIHYASLQDFAKETRVKVVEHADLDRLASMYRAEWLVDNPPDTTYHLFGLNCEHVARWCATERAECVQAQSAFRAQLSTWCGVHDVRSPERPAGWAGNRRGRFAGCVALPHSY
jgi:hypothetical protein